MTRARHPRGAVLRSLTPIVRRLHLQELPRLRREAARLADEVDQLRYELSCADMRADMLQMMNDGQRIGLTMAGDVVSLGPVAHHSPTDEVTPCL
jgi:hypothetical protein